VIDVIAVLCMCVGLILFTLADSSVSPSFNTYGKYIYVCIINVTCGYNLPCLILEILHYHQAEIVLYI